MKPLDKKDMPKLLALVGLTVCSLGYGVYTLVAGVSYGQAAAPAPKDNHHDPAQAAPAPGAAGQVASEESPMMRDLKTLEQVADPVVTRDPFLSTATPVPAMTPPPPGPTAAPPGPVLSQIQKSPGTAVGFADKQTRDLATLLGVRPTLKPNSAPSVINEITSMTGSKPVNLEGPVPHVVVPSPPPPVVEVSGVMVAESEGVKSVALLRIDSRARWVSVGDPVGNNFVVHSIRRTDRGSEVEIVDSHNAKRRYTFKVN